MSPEWSSTPEKSGVTKCAPARTNSSAGVQNSVADAQGWVALQASVVHCNVRASKQTPLASPRQPARQFCNVARHIAPPLCKSLAHCSKHDCIPVSPALTQFCTHVLPVVSTLLKHGCAPLAHPPAQVSELGGVGHPVAQSAGVALQVARAPVNVLRQDCLHCGRDASLGQPRRHAAYEVAACSVHTCLLPVQLCWH